MVRPHEDPQWVRLNSQKAAIDDLEIFADLLEQIHDTPNRARWAVIALHSSLQNFFVAQLAGGRPDAVLINGREVRQWRDTYITEHDAAMKRFGSDQEGLERWIDNYCKTNPMPEEKLFHFAELFKMAVGDRGQYPDVGTLNHEFRRAFVHLRSVGWSIRILLLLDIFDGCLPLLERYATSPMPAMLGEPEEDRGRAAIERIKLSLARLRKQLEE